MAKSKPETKRRILRAGPLTKILLLLLLIGIGWQLYRLQGQVADAQAERDLLAAEAEVPRISRRETPRRRWRKSPGTSWAWFSPASTCFVTE